MSDKKLIHWILWGVVIYLGVGIVLPVLWALFFVGSQANPANQAAAQNTANNIPNP